MKRFRITVNNRTYEVEAEVLSEFKPTDIITPSHSARIRVGEVAPAPKKTEAPPVHAAGEVRSPLSGKIVSVEAKVGQHVSEGERVLTLEAMKMNTFVIAPQNGIVEEIMATAGQSVEEGALLIKLQYLPEPNKTEPQQDAEVDKTGSFQEGGDKAAE